MNELTVINEQKVLGKSINNKGGIGMTDEKLARDYAEHNQGKYTNEFGNLYHAFLAGFKAGKPQWHDLWKNSGDLPKGDCKVLTYSEAQSFQIKQFFVGGDAPCFDDLACKEVIAWCEIPSFGE